MAMIRGCRKAQALALLFELLLVVVVASSSRLIPSNCIDDEKFKTPIIFSKFKIVQDSVDIL
jgi:hypothetical protein